MRADDKHGSLLIHSTLFTMKCCNEVLYFRVGVRSGLLWCGLIVPIQSRCDYYVLILILPYLCN